MLRYFLERHGAGRGHFLSDGALAVLRRREWPGNVRQLENAVQRALVLSDGPELGPADFEWDEGASTRTRGSYDALWRAVREGRTPGDIREFGDLYGKLALAEMMRRASAEAGTDREAGRLLGFIPEDDPGDRAFNNYRSWKRRVLELSQGAGEGTDAS